MRVLCCYVDFVQSNCAEAMKKFAPDTEYVVIDKEDPYGYAKAIGERWNSGDSLLIVEPDNEITAEVISTMSSCQKPWCSYSYNIFAPPFTRECATGLGCTKFSAKLQSELNYESVILNGICDNCHSLHSTWGELDCRVSAVLEDDFSVFVHKHGSINHYHPYKAFGPDDIVTVCESGEASITIRQPDGYKA